MDPVVAMLAAAALVGAMVTMIALRWPGGRVGAPALAPSTIAAGVRQRPRLGSFLRRRVDPEAATGLALTLALVLTVAGGVAVGVLLLTVRRHVGFARWDLGAARWGAVHATATSTPILRDVSQLGGTLGVLGVALLVGALEWHRRPSRGIVIFLAVLLVGQNLLANGIKVLVNRARPDLDQLTGFSGSSFPSGHATAAAAAYAGLALVMGRGRTRRVRALLAGGAAAVAVGVATTRILLGVHWLTDVMAGLALGWAWFGLCSIAVGGRLLRFGEPVVVAEHVADQVAENTDDRVTEHVGSVRTQS